MKAGMISDKESIVVELPHDGSCLNVTQLGLKSNEVDVNDGDTIQISLTKWYRIAPPLAMTLFILPLFIEDLSNEMNAALYIFVISLIILTFLTDAFHLNVSGRDS